MLMLARGLAESRERARRLIMAGEVRVNGVVQDKAGFMVRPDAEVEVRTPLPYVSRGGLKLAAALNEFALDVTGLVAIDVGASTGGFSDCLLQRGVGHVFAVDVGYGQLAWSVRSDARVTPIERTNIRYLTELPDGARANLAVIDASFISLALVLPATLLLLEESAQIIALVKPQFEAGRAQVGRGGVVRDPAVHRAVLDETVALARSLHLGVRGITVSPAPGPAGNIEFLIWLQKGMLSKLPPEPDLEKAITLALANAQKLRKK